MIDKTELRKIIKASDMVTVKEALQENPGTIRKIQRMLYDIDEEVRWGAARAFGIASTVLEIEKVKDILRQLVWMINEESGNNCWFAPQAIGEIGRLRPDLVEDFIGCLKEFHKYPDSKIKEGIDYAFDIFREAGLEV